MNKNIKKLSKFIIIFSYLALTLSQVVTAHERFIVPSHTVLSGDKTQYVTLISSISNDIFHPDRPLGNNDKGIDAGDLSNLFGQLNSELVSPTGNTSLVEWQAFQRMSVSDVKVKQSGTYRIAIIQNDIAMTTFKKSDGSPGRIFGTNSELPKDVTDIVRRTTASKVETFISVNEPNNIALKPTTKGLSLGVIYHPNDLFSGENVSFKVFFNGLALTKKSTVKLIKAGTRHRNSRDEQLLTINKQGIFSFTPDTAGFYFLAIETAINVAQPAEVDVKHYSLYTTLEVFAE